MQPQKFSKKGVAGIETRIVYGIYAGEISNRDRFRDVNNQRRMNRIHKYVSDLTSFEEGKSFFHRMKKHSSRRFKEITKMLREEDKKRKEKKEQRKEMDARDNG